MTRNQSHDDEGSSSGMRSKSCAPWSDLDHNLLFIIMMKLRFADYYSFRGVCMSWRLLADSNKNKFMASMPPMSITISSDANKNVCCYLEDFEGRKFKTILPDFTGGDCIGVTCGHLILFNERTRDFWLVNPITRKQLHFPHCPFDYDLGRVSGRAILVFSPSISAWVFVMLHRGKIWYYVAGENLYMTGWVQVYRNSLVELDLGEKKWLKPCEKTIEEYAFFRSDLNNVVVAVRRESWADPLSRSQVKYSLSSHTCNNGKIRLFTAKMWYFPHECMNVDRIDE